MTQLLAGVRVIESAMLLNGASTTMMLADLGAEIIKIESPFLGDYIRHPDTIHMHRQANRGKRSLALDMKKPEGREVFARLLKTADVFVTNAVSNRNARLGLDYDTLQAIKPDIVYCQNTGYGATGPYSAVPTHGQMMDAIAGGMPVTTDAQGYVIPDPKFARRTGSLASASEGTAAGAIYSAFHIAAALVHRDRTGKGACLDTSSAAASLVSAWASAAALLNVPGRAGWWQDDDNTKSIARYQSYRTSDNQYILFCPEERKFWDSFCDAVERPELKSEERGLELRIKVQSIIETRTLDEWMALAVERNIPIGPIHNDIEGVRNDPQMKARQIIEEGETEGGAAFVHLRQPVLVDGAPSEIGGPPPDLGQHTDEILKELGFDDLSIADLHKKQVTSAPVRDAGHISSAIYGKKT